MKDVFLYSEGRRFIFFIESVWHYICTLSVSIKNTYNFCGQGLLPCLKESGENPGRTSLL